MERRTLLTGAAAAAGLAAAGGAGAQGRDAGKPQVLELRKYTFATPDKRAAFERFAAEALIPALNRLAIKPVGVFKMTKADNPQATFAGDTAPDLYVLLPHPSADSAATLDARLAADAAYTKALGTLNETPKDPAYARYESSLLLAFDQCPKVELPAKGPDRVLQLRIYENRNETASRLKVRMFNEGGELRLFRQLGMNPVFMGHAFSGELLPNVTYMLGFESPGALNTAWNAFRGHPDWKKLQADPTYLDTVSRVTNLILRPAAGSQV